MAEATATVEAPVGGNADVDAPAADDAALQDFLLPEAEEETEFIPGEKLESVEEETEEKPDEEVKSEGKEEKEEEKPEEKEEQLYTVKVDGKEFEINEQELIRGYQLARTSNERLKVAQQHRQDVEKVLLTLKNDPLKILTNPALGLDFRKIAEDYLIEQLKMEQMDPQQRALEQARAELRREQEQIEAQKRLQEEAEITRQTQVQAEIIDREFTTALQTAKIPKTPTVVKRMAELAQQALSAGYDPTAVELADMVRQEIIQAQREVMGAMDPSQIEELVGKDKMKAVRQADVQKAKAKGQTTREALKQFKPEARPSGKRYVSERDLREHLDKTMGRK